MHHQTLVPRFNGFVYHGLMLFVFCSFSGFFFLRVHLDRHVIEYTYIYVYYCYDYYYVYRSRRATRQFLPNSTARPPPSQLHNKLYTPNKTPGGGVRGLRGGGNENPKKRRNKSLPERNQTDSPSRSAGVTRGCCHRVQPFNRSLSIMVVFFVFVSRENRCTHAPSTRLHTSTCVHNTKRARVLLRRRRGDETERKKTSCTYGGRDIENYAVTTISL